MAVVLAKSTGLTLTEHTDDLRDQFREEILPRHPFVAQKYLIRTKQSLVELVMQSIQWHDAGKKENEWQLPCQRDYELWKRWDAGGRVAIEPRGLNLMKAGIRHEMASVERLLKKVPDASPIVRAAIAAHHGKLSHYYKDRWTDDCGGRFFGLWRFFRGLSEDVEEFEEAIERRYEYAGPRSWLQLADRRASAKESGRTLARFEEFTYTFPPSWTKRGVQKTIEELWNDPVGLLRAPTGAGKTDAALLWAKHQIEESRADRLVVLMPTRFTANSLSINDAQAMNTRGLYHSTTWYQLHNSKSSLSQDKRAKFDQDLDMARLLGTPVTVTTIDHACISLTGTREDHHSVFFNLAHSCVVIDEADFYDDFTQANLVILLRVLRLLNVPVLIMSATLPESSKLLYGVEKIYEDITDNSRVRCLVSRFATPVVGPKDIAHLLKPALRGTPMILYANTVARAQRYYNWLTAEGRMAPSEVVLYHSRFTEPDKIAIEDRLMSMLGKDAWENGTAHGVAILTQIGELSVNISADHMITELCPLDRLVQRIGRLSRFSKTTIGNVHVIRPFKRTKNGERSLYPAPYGSYRKNQGWVPSQTLSLSDDLLVNGYYSAADFVDLVNKLYPEMAQMLSHVRKNQDELKTLIISNWLMQPGQKIDQDDNETKEWQCRDIDPTTIVLAGIDQSSILSNQFDDRRLTRTDWRKLELEHGIGCRAYELDAAIKNGMVKEDVIVVGNSDDFVSEKVWLVEPSFYNATSGLSFTDPEDDNDSE